MAAVDPEAECPADLVRPGHIFPLRAREGGVLVRCRPDRRASSTVCRLAGLRPAGVICEIMNDDGTMARVPELEFAGAHDLKLASIAEPGRIPPPARADHRAGRGGPDADPNARRVRELHLPQRRSTAGPTWRCASGIDRPAEAGRAVPADR